MPPPWVVNRNGGYRFLAAFFAVFLAFFAMVVIPPFVKNRVCERVIRASARLLVDHGRMPLEVTALPGVGHDPQHRARVSVLVAMDRVLRAASQPFAHGLKQPLVRLRRVERRVVDESAERGDARHWAPQRAQRGC